MNKLESILMKVYACNIKFFFSVYEIFRAHLSSRQKLKILFSDGKAWGKNITTGFHYMQHELDFGSFRNSDIEKYDLVVPLFIDDLLYLNNLRYLCNHNPIPIPSVESILLCDDKYLFIKKLTESDFRDFIPKTGIMKKYPYILKKKIDEWGKNSYIINNYEKEQEYINLLNDPEYFHQELIPGSREYATHIIIKKGKIICSLNIEYVFEIDTPIKGKDKFMYQKLSCCPFLDIFTSLLVFIEFEGLCCINYKVLNGRPMILEINPRFGGSLAPFFFSCLRHI